MFSRWVFTVNNVKETEANEALEFYEGLHDLYADKKNHIKFICGQMEEGTNMHFQGYVQLTRNQRKSWLINNISSHGSYEAQSKYSTNTQARDYAIDRDGKDTMLEQYEEIILGKFCKGQEEKGKRTDIHEFKDDIKSGMSRAELIDKHPRMMAQYPKFYRETKLAFGKHRIRDVKIELRYGYPGKGKSETVLRDYGDNIFLESFAEDVWFDMYDGQKVACFDEFNGRASKMGLARFLTLTDRITRVMRVKNSHCWFEAETIVITTNTHPKLWYLFHDRVGDFECLKRRINSILYYDEECEWGVPKVLTPEEVEEFWRFPQRYGAPSDKIFTE